MLTSAVYSKPIISLKTVARCVNRRELRVVITRWTDRVHALDRKRPRMISAWFTDFEIPELRRAPLLYYIVRSRYCYLTSLGIRRWNLWCSSSRPFGRCSRRRTDVITAKSSCNWRLFPTVRIVIKTWVPNYKFQQHVIAVPHWSLSVSNILPYTFLMNFCPRVFGVKVW